ncbi:THUMP domain-containing protein 1-like [Artemia franciscana]|uniref:THUMP domain-containing protein n=1 Tax=Artemia franciscana TaxID=6661 RepID=A0AA88L3A9_ARTSF|nr:hypothetical protein QYM36_012636 [Artemia franciscana]
MTGERKRKAKEYYKKSAKAIKLKGRQLSPGLKGFLCTCNNAEKQCVREAYNILNEVSDKLYGLEKKSPACSEDIESDLDSELKSLRTAEIEQKRFQVVDSGANNVVFIKTTVPSPLEVAQKIINDIKENGEQKTRFLLRLLPVELTCRASIEEIKKALQPIITEHFKDAKNFHIQVHARNSNIKRDNILPELLCLFQEIYPQLIGTLVKPHKSLILEIIKSTVCICIAEEYDENAKYNLIELSKKCLQRNMEIKEEVPPQDEDEIEKGEAVKVEDKKGGGKPVKVEDRPEKEKPSEINNMKDEEKTKTAEENTDKGSEK